MEKIIILLAGFPGTGKTYLSHIIQSQLGEFFTLSQDEIKEKLFDIHGFSNLDEKQEIENMAWKIFYTLMEEKMLAGVNIISDYPFSQKQKPYIEEFVAKYNYQVITVRLIGDLEVLFERNRKRDLDQTRHLSHLVSSYKNGDYLADRTKADRLLTLEEFIKRCTTRGYESFELGKLFEVDVTDYSKVNYTQLIKDIRFWIENCN